MHITEQPPTYRNNPRATQARTTTMIQQYRDGATLQQIGDTWNVSRERVRQILSANGITRTDQGTTEREAARAARAAEDTETARQCQQWLTTQGPTLRSAIIARFPDAANRLRAWINDGTVDPALVVRDPLHTKDDHWTLETAAQKVRQLWEEAGRPTNQHGALTGTMYDKLAGARGDAPSRALLTSRWGWRTVLETADVPYHEGVHRTYTRNWTTGDILDHVARWWSSADRGTTTSYQSYERWARNDPDAPSGATVRNRLHAEGTTSWSDIVRAAAHRTTTHHEEAI